MLDQRDTSSSSEALVEADRLAALRSLGILDTPAEGAFDHVSSLAARFFKTPIALISLVDEDRIWFKSKHGMDTSEIARSPGLCASVILSDAAYVVKDALKDPRTLANPLVAGSFGLRFYAAAPLITHEGFRLGTINVIDFVPRDFDEEGEAALREFANIVMDQMDLRLSAIETVSSLAKTLNAVRSGGGLQRVVTVCAWTKKIKLDNEWVSFEEFLGRQLGLSVSHGINPDVADEMLKRFEPGRSDTRR